VAADGGIRCVGCRCAEQAAGATRLLCPAGVASPALINPHDHLGFTQNAPRPQAQRCLHRHDWRIGRSGCEKVPVPGNATEEQKIWGELRHLLGGAASIAGAGKARGLLRNVEEGEAEGRRVRLSTFPLGDAGGETRTEGCAYPDIDQAAEVLAADAYVPHVAEGISLEAHNEYTCLSNTADGGQDLAEANSAFIHSIALDARDYFALVQGHTAVIWSPRSNIELYGDTAQVTVVKALGGVVALGTDWTATGSMNMLRELRCADYLNRVHYDGAFTDRELWLMTTLWAARALGIHDRFGALQAGHAGDIAVFDGRQRTDHRAIIDAGVRDVRLVLRSGEVLYGDAELVAGLPGGASCEELPGGICGVPRRLCTERETGFRFAALVEANRSSYDLYSCGDPDPEPSCQPMRPSPLAYGPTPTPGDADGDGVADGEDNCPRRFNPPRPMDLHGQGDADGDRLGDGCDPCPLDAGAAGCIPLDPFDSDSDGLADSEDNCPGEPNARQEDRDDDGHGDACDGCPFEANPGDEPCPATIQEIRQEVFALGAKVRVAAALVTAASGNGFFVQSKPGDPGHAGPEFSGLFVYHPAEQAAQPRTGLRVDIIGDVGDYYGETQLTRVELTLVTRQPEELPRPVAVICRNLVDDPEHAMALEGALIRVGDTSAAALDPEPGPGDRPPTGEFLLDCGLRVNDYLFRPDPFPELGERFDAVIGVLHWANGNFKIEPRGEADLLGPPRLHELRPSTVLLPFGNGVAGPPEPGPLAVVLRRVVEDGEVRVETSSEAPDVLEVGPVTVVAAGARQAEVRLVPHRVRQLPVRVIARHAGTERSAEVRIYDPAAPPPAGRLVINELDYDQPGNDTAEFLELYNAGEAPVAIAGVAVFFVNGDGGRSYKRIDLAGDPLPPGGFLLLHGLELAPPQGCRAVAMPAARDNIQNGPDAVLLLDTATGQVLDALSYEGCLHQVALGDLAGSYAACEGEAGGPTDAGEGSLARTPDGEDGDDNQADFTAGVPPTPCAANR
ncbi:MAG: amidohydrolase family protein, partial [Deltaproteobacteria bacterium]|nr:amidohydrolase family protein [Deltaproteobacteria bacterium]